MHWAEEERAAARAKRSGDLSRAILLYEGLLQRPGIPVDSQLTIMNTLADLLRRTGRYEASLDVAERLVAERRVHGPKLLLGNDLVFMSQILGAVGRLRDARSAVAEALPIYEQAMGSDHSQVGMIRSMLRYLDTKLA